jgi:hypothetical protein
VAAGADLITPTRQIEAAPGLHEIRSAVRALLESSPAYERLEPADRRRLAQGMVRICYTAAQLKHDSGTLDENGAGQERQPALAMTQAAGGGFAASAQQAPEVARRILNAVSFPRFVTDLINGVFKAMLDSNIAQMNSFVELINNVSASVEGFADAQMAPDRARQWLAERYPASFDLNVEPGDSESGTQAQVSLVLKPGAPFPSAEALKVDLGLGPDDSPPTGNPEALVPFARRQLAQMRQQMLSTMVQMGLQRIVIDSGRISASMRFHIDTHSAAAEDKASRLESDTGINLAGSYGMPGVFGISASISENISYVSTQKEQTTEEMNTDLDLNSAVEVNFKSDYVPLNRLATSQQVGRIQQNSLNPEAEATTARSQRETRQSAAEQARQTAMDTSLTPHPPAQGQNPLDEVIKSAQQAASKAGASAPGQSSATGTKSGGGGGGAAPPAAPPATTPPANTSPAPTTAH